MEIDLSQLPAKTRTAVDQVLRRTFDRRIYDAVRRQQAVAAMNCLRPPSARDGFGPMIWGIEPYIDAFWRACYGHNYSHDPDLMKFLVRRNPEIGVRSRGTKIQVGYAPSSASRKPINANG